MKKLLFILSLSLITLDTTARADSDYYQRVCDQYHWRSRDLDQWCGSYQKHMEHGQSTKNDKGHIDELVRDNHDDAREHNHDPRGHYDDWQNRERGAYGNYQPAPNHH